MIKQYSIPENLKNKDYSLDDAYRENFKNWIEEIWEKKDSEIESLKF
jgi:ABC-type cobalt transport system substrate-binding protein